MLGGQVMLVPDKKLVQNAIAIITTTDTREEAMAIARALVESQLVACAQISEIESVYRWEGVVQQEKEFRLVLKSIQANYEAVEAAIVSQHSYDLPGVYAVALDNIYTPFSAWITENSLGE